MRGMLIMFCITTAAAGTFVCVLAARRMVDRGTLLTISGVLLGMLAQLAPVWADTRERMKGGERNENHLN